MNTKYCTHSCPSNLNKMFSLQRCQTLSCLRELDDVLKEFKEINTDLSNEIVLPMPTLSETEFINRIIDEKMEIISVNPHTKYEDSETISESDEIILNLESYEYASIQNYSNHVKIPTRSKTCQLSPEIDFGKNDEKPAIVTELHDTDNNKISESLNTTFQMEFESYVTQTKDYNFLYEILVEAADTAVNKVENDNTTINIGSERTIEFNFISDNEIETILLNSTDNELSKHENTNSNESDCDGYNSSDFEFITEDEAGLGLVTDVHAKDRINKPKATNNNKEYPSNLANYFIEPSNRGYYSLGEDKDNFQDLYRNEHVIPNHDEYLELFSQPRSVYNFEAENKAFYSTKTMHVEVDNIGFNVGLLERRHEENKIDPVFQKEAEENAKKIISTYSNDNRKRRRRI